MKNYEIIKEEKDFYKIISLKVLRQTPGVIFDIVPLNAIDSIDGIDRVIHQRAAISPGSVGSCKRPWYMHPHQQDHLLVLSGARHIELYCLKTKKLVTVTISPYAVSMDNVVVSESPAILSWSTYVFHRIISDEHSGSASINIASRFSGFDIRTNFNIFDLDTATGSYSVIREGHLDQPG